MPLDTCITNVGEYYSSHYLDSTFTKDVKALVADWNQQGSQSPPRRLQNLSPPYFRAKTQALDEDEPIRRQFTGEAVRGWHAYLLQALGYNDLTAFDHPVEGGDTFVPTLGRVNRYNKPWLVICETHFCLPDGSLKEGMPSEDPLGMEPYKDPLNNQADHKLCAGDWSRCLGRLFTEEDAPRWILLLAGSQVLLLDRNTFAQGRFLAFDLDDAFGRKEKDTFNHMAAFLAAETLCPGGESDEVLLDKLEEQSHRFAHGVTESLQFAVREAIELLVNEWARDRTENQKRPLLRLRPEELRADGRPVTIDLPPLDDGSYEITAELLKREALAFVYRLLFCFYAEARRIEPVRYGDELRRVKHYITTRNVYGVDLNPTAVELGALSLWLGSIHRLLQKKGENGGRDRFVCGATPWFGLRLRCGNSLIGARRAVWTAAQLRKGKHGGKNSETPRLLKPGEKRGEDEVYHFLVFDEDMAPTHKDKLMRDFWPERCAAAKKWIAQQVKPKWDTVEIKEALAICDLIDQHWEK